MSHAPIAPSSMGVTVYCSGSVMMQAQYPQESTDESKGGDAAHWVCSDSLEAIKRNEKPPRFVGLKDPAHTIITQEMQEAADVFIDACLSVVADTGNFAAMHIEERVNCTRVHPLLNYGTPDFWARVGNVIYVKDFKFGFSFVDEFENWQMMDYAAGILDQLGIDGIQDRNMYIDMEVIQPRYYRAESVRSWRILAADLRAFVNIMRGASEAALGPNPKCTSGDHCKNCTARRACPAARQSSYWAMQVATEATPINLPASAVGLELDYIKRAISALKCQETGLEEYADSLVTHGKVVPGYARQPSSGNRAWIAKDAQVIMIGNACGVDLRSPKPVTPAEAERMGLDKTFVKSQTHRPSKMKLKRVNSNEIKKVFS